MSIDISPSLICSCNRVIYEVDSLYCQGCGDVMCYTCLTSCSHCQKLYCKNCSENSEECIKCYMEPPVVEKAYIVIDGESTPVKNSQFLIGRTSISNARDITLKLDGRLFQYNYRSMCQRKDNKDAFDYFIHFEEIIDDSYEKYMQQLEEEYETTNPFERYNRDYDEYDEYDMRSLANLKW